MLDFPESLCASVSLVNTLRKTSYNYILFMAEHDMCTFFCLLQIENLSRRRWQCIFPSVQVKVLARFLPHPVLMYGSSECAMSRPEQSQQQHNAAPWAVSTQDGDPVRCRSLPHTSATRSRIAVVRTPRWEIAWFYHKMLCAILRVWSCRFHYFSLWIRQRRSWHRQVPAP